MSSAGAPRPKPGALTSADYASGLGGVRQTHTGVSNVRVGKGNLQKQTIMISPGVYKTRTAAVNMQYAGFDEGRECENGYKVKLTLPEKWLDNPTPALQLKTFFMKAYRKKFPDAPLSLLSDGEIELAIKDESMFMFSKKVVDETAIIAETFIDRQDVFVMGQQDWEDMDKELKKYRRVIVKALAHCHRSVTDTYDQIVPVTSAKQLAPTNSYVIFTGWYKMQCVMVKPDMTIADLKQYLHEKTGSRMPLECIDVGVRSGDDIRIIDDALTLQQVYERAISPNPDFGTGPGTLVGDEEEADADEAQKEAERKAAEELEANKDRRGPDGKYFRRHDTTSRVHADWDNEDATLKTYSVDDQAHTASADAADSDTLGPQKPMHLRGTHAPKEGKYDYLTKDGEVATIARIGADEQKDGAIEEVPEEDDDDSRVVDVTDGVERQTLAGLEPESAEAKAAAKAAAARAEAKAAAKAAADKEEAEKAEAEKTALAKSTFVGKTLVLGVGKRIQDVKHKIWVATVHDPYSFRGPEDRAAGGGAKEDLALQQNGAPKGWSAPPEGQASVNADDQCSIM